MKIYHNRRCSKSRAALAILEEKNTPLEIIEYLKTPPSAVELSKILGMLNMKSIDLIRKGEELYKEKVIHKNLSDGELIQLMVKNPILIERPIVVHNGKAVIGRPPENVLFLIKN